ncbi:nucleolar and coiled-body phosphoprotein 1-like [Haliotis asinina]|uniref:nucleolar and coiled-body phosphoprotein 1-like n=1 Tax=Haliotis asinina TaxID=109174 RepID=UPI0035327C2C
MFRFLRRENLAKQSQQSISCPAINSPQKDGDSPSESSSESDGEIAEVSRKQRMFARRSIRRDRKKQKEQQKKIENNMISMDDYLSKQAEFKMWLKEEKQKTAADLKSPKLKAYFKDFMKLWNKKKLPQKYYRGSTGTDTPPPSRNHQRFSFVEGSPFSDIPGFHHPIDLSLEGAVLLDSPFSTFGKSPGEPLTAQSTPRIIKLPDIKNTNAVDKENSCTDGNIQQDKPEPVSEKKKKKSKNTTPKKSKMKKDNPYKVTVLSWTSKGELNVCPSSPAEEKEGKLKSLKPVPPKRTSQSTKLKLDTSIPYEEVKDANPLEVSDYDPLYADPDPFFSGSLSVSRSKSLDSGLHVESPRPVTDGCKSVEEIYAVPMKKKRMSAEKDKVVEVVTSPPPPLPPKRKSPLESWPYQVIKGDEEAPIFSMKKDGPELASPAKLSNGSKSVFSPQKTESPMRMAVSMPDLCDPKLDPAEEVDSSSSSSSSLSNEESETETFELKVKITDPEVQAFLDEDPTTLPPPPDLVSDIYPPVRLSLLPPPPPELLMDTPPMENEYRPSIEAFGSQSSLIAECGTPRSSKVLEEGMSLHCHTTPKSVLSLDCTSTETPPPTLVPITPFSLPSLEAVNKSEERSQDMEPTPQSRAPQASVLAVPVQVTEVKEMSTSSRRVSVGPVMIPPPMKSKLHKPDLRQLTSESEASMKIPSSTGDILNQKPSSTGDAPNQKSSPTLDTPSQKPSSTGDTPNHNYLTDALTDLDTSAEKDEVFTYRQALSGAMKSLKSAYASSVEDITADVPRRHRNLGRGLNTNLYTEDVIDQRTTPKHDARNRHHSENSANHLKRNIQEMKEPGGSSSSTSSSVSENSEVKKVMKKPPALKPKPNKGKVAEAVEKARQRQLSSDRSSVSSSASDCSSVSSDKSSRSSSEVSGEENVQRKPSSSCGSVSRVLGSLNQNRVSQSTPSPKKPPRTFSAKRTNGENPQSPRTPLTPTGQVKSILKTTPVSGSCDRGQGQNLDKKASCSRSLTEKVMEQTRPSMSAGVFETDIDSVLDDDCENRDPNCASRGVRETDLDRILEEMQSNYPLSPLLSVDTASEMNI